MYEEPKAIWHTAYWVSITLSFQSMKQCLGKFFTTGIKTSQNFSDFENEAISSLKVI